LVGSIGGNNTVVVLATSGARSQEIGVDCAADYLPEVGDWLLLHCVRIADIALDDFIERKLESLILERDQVFFCTSVEPALSWFSISPARITIGPRTAYCTALTRSFIESMVKTYKIQ
jgi:hypothetical protein